MRWTAKRWKLSAVIGPRKAELEDAIRSHWDYAIEPVGSVLEVAEAVRAFPPAYPPGRHPAGSRPTDARVGVELGRGAARSAGKPEARPEQPEEADRSGRGERGGGLAVFAAIFTTGTADRRRVGVRRDIDVVGLSRGPAATGPRERAPNPATHRMEVSSDG